MVNYFSIFSGGLLYVKICFLCHVYWQNWVIPSSIWDVLQGKTKLDMSRRRKNIWTWSMERLSHLISRKVQKNSLHSPQLWLIRPRSIERRAWGHVMDRSFRVPQPRTISSQSGYMMRNTYWTIHLGGYLQIDNIFGIYCIHDGIMWIEWNLLGVWWVQQPQPR